MTDADRALCGAGKDEGCFKRALIAAAVVMIVLVVGACSETDVEQVRLCRSLIGALVSDPGTVRLGLDETVPGNVNAVRVHYQAGPDTADHWILCRFAGAGLAEGRLDLTGVETDTDGKLSDVKLHMLRRFWLGSFQLREDAGASHGPAGIAPRWQAYVLQQMINASVLGCVYAMLAIAYTLVFGILSRINLAFGDLTMLAGFATLAGIQVAAMTGATMLALALLAILAVAVLTTAAWSGVTERLAFRPLRHAPGQAILIVTIGLAIALRELVRLQFGAGERWLPPVLSDTIVLLTQNGFTVTVTPFHVLIVVGTVALFIGHTRFFDRKSFGFYWRACAQDRQMAALCGVNVDRIVAKTFVVAGAYTGLAGWTIALHYGSVSFYMGAVLGFKALTAAVIGGIGSVSGAFVGGLALGLVETLWSAYLPTDYRDVFVFALLAATLIFRPRGLFGSPAAERVAGIGESRHAG